MMGICMTCERLVAIRPGPLQDMKSAQDGRRADYYPIGHDDLRRDPPVRCDGHTRAIR